jgi:hypothetical protein
MKRTLQVFVLALALIGTVSASWAGKLSAKQKPVSQPAPRYQGVVLAPVFLECKDPMASQTALQLTEMAIKNMGLDLIEPYRVSQALREFDFRNAPADLYPQPLGGYPPLSFPPPGQLVRITDLFWPYPGFSPSKTGHLLWLGERLKAKLVFGVEYKIHSKTTLHLGGAHLNGRNQTWLTIIDVPKKQVCYIYWPKDEKDEFGLVAGESKRQLGIGVTVLGSLAAGGLIGRGGTTRTLGWIGLIAPHVTGAAGDETQIQIDATLLAINTVFSQAYRYIPKL